MTNINELISGVYSGKEINGNYGWLIKDFTGGKCFIIRGYYNGLIRHNQLDEFLKEIDKNLDPEIDLEDFYQLYQQIQKMGHKFPFLLEIIDSIQKIVDAYSYVKYDSIGRIEFPPKISKVIMSQIRKENNF